MATVVPGRMTAELEGDFVVFLIGIRINKLWKVHKWWHANAAMGPMLKVLMTQRERGLLGFHTHLSWRGVMLVQYWRSFADLDRFARDPNLSHQPAWRDFNRRSAAGGDVGVWHETYLVSSGQHESVYVNMPRFGLADAAGHVPVGKRGESAAQRLSR